MIDLPCGLLATARSSLTSQRGLALENLALRRQLAVLKRTTKRPKLTKADRVFWVALPRLWKGWQHALILVKPETVIRWHRKGFRRYWTWKSRIRGGGLPPKLGPERVSGGRPRARRSIDSADNRWRPPNRSAMVSACGRLGQDLGAA